MRVALLAVLCLACTPVLATDFYWVLDADPDDPSAVHYTTPDQACHVAYDANVLKMAAVTYTQAQPYQAPTLIPGQPPGHVVYTCQTTAYSPTNQDSITLGDTITRGGDGCTSGQTFNPQTAKCESPDEDQDRKEMGDPTSPVVAGIVSCGDPVNVGTGNVFEQETDYADADGELRFVRSYNSTVGDWKLTYDTHLYISSKALVLNFNDGRSSLFTLSNGVATPEPTELGTMIQVNGSWVIRRRKTSSSRSMI